MNSIKILIASLFMGVLFNACNSVYQETIEDNFNQQVHLKNRITEYDLWYVDYHRTNGDLDIPFISKAFTLSFVNGVLYANNNIVDIGITGDGFGIDVSTYNTINGLLELNHDVDGINNFEVTFLSGNEIRLYNRANNIDYYLIGYQTNNFDYDKLFYENIEYFLQEYEAWEKVKTTGGIPNTFDDENYLAFTPENTTTFYSSQDNFGTHIADLIWDYVGSYEIYDIADYDNLKIITLLYDNNDEEEFELSIINDGTINLYNVDSETTYTFSGRGFKTYLKGENRSMQSKNRVRNNNRKRTKIKRNIKRRRN